MGLFFTLLLFVFLIQILYLHNIFIYRYNAKIQKRNNRRRLQYFALCLLNDAVVKSPKTVSFRAKRKILLKQSL